MKNRSFAFLIAFIELIGGGLLFALWFIPPFNLIPIGASFMLASGLFCLYMATKMPREKESEK